MVGAESGGGTVLAVADGRDGDAIAGGRSEKTARHLASVFVSYTYSYSKQSKQVVIKVIFGHAKHHFFVSIQFAMNTLPKPNL